MIFFLILFVILLSLFGCQESIKEDQNELHDKKHGEKSGNEGNDLYKVDVFDFAFIKKAPEATEKQDIDKVIKVYFNENDSSIDQGFAIDLEEENVYINPRMGSRGIRTSIEEPVHVGDIDGVLEVLQKHNVQKWKDDYTFESPESYQDGYGWQLWLQFEDGTVEKHKGSGTKKDNVTPDNFNEFSKELRSFIEGKLKD